MSCNGIVAITVTGATSLVGQFGYLISGTFDGNFDLVVW